VLTEHGDVDLTKVTIKPGADLNSASNEELSPLQLAAKHGHLRLVQWLLKSGATVGAADKNGFTALHEAGADAAAQSTEEVGVIEVGTTAAALAEKGERCRSVAKENPSTSNTRLSRVLHSIQRELRLARPGRMIARVCAWSDLGLRRGWGTISSLQAARGGGTRAASRFINSSRDSWMALSRPTQRVGTHGSLRGGGGASTGGRAQPRSGGDSSDDRFLGGL
jgi:hypothetical protein